MANFTFLANFRFLTLQYIKFSTKIRVQSDFTENMFTLKNDSSLIDQSVSTRPSTSVNRCKMYAPERQPTKVTESSFDLERRAQGQI